MQSSDQLQTLLHSVNRKSYPAYKSLRGAYQFDRYILSIDHVQGDPFASPSHISVKLTHRDTCGVLQRYPYPHHTWRFS